MLFTIFHQSLPQRLSGSRFRSQWSWVVALSLALVGEAVAGPLPAESFGREEICLGALKASAITGDEVTFPFHGEPGGRLSLDEIRARVRQPIRLVTAYGDVIAGTLLNVLPNREDGFDLRISVQREGEPPQVVHSALDRVLNATFQNVDRPIPGEPGWFPENWGDLSHPDVQRHDEVLRSAALARLNRRLSPGRRGDLRRAPPEEAVREIYREYAGGRIFNDGTRSSPQRQRFYQERVFRDAAEIFYAAYGNMFAPHVEHLPELRTEFYSALRRLMDSVTDQTPDSIVKIYTISVWAGEVSLLIHQGMDTNSAARRAVMNYVIAYMGERLGISLPIMNFEDPGVRNAAVVYSESRVQGVIQPFNIVFKDYVIQRLQRLLEAFAISRGQRYLFFLDPRSQARPDPAYAELLDPIGDPKGSMLIIANSSHPGWVVLRDFILNLIHGPHPETNPITADDLVADPVYRAVAEWMIHYSQNSCHSCFRPQ